MVCLFPDATILKKSNKNNILRYGTEERTTKNKAKTNFEKYFQKIKKCNIIQKSKNILLHSIEFKIFTIQNRVIKLKSTIHFKM